MVLWFKTFLMRSQCRQKLLYFCLCFLAVVGLFGCRDRPDSDLIAEQTEAAPASPTTQLNQLDFATLPPPTIEVVLQTPTPLPTATATPTPTPIIYVIQGGDTLLGIAIDQRTTVEDIQALNPDARPELLSIGQEIILPPPATPVFSGEQPTLVPVQIEVLSSNLYPDGAGGLWVIGEVRNLSAGMLQNLKLSVELFGTGGGSVGFADVWAAKDQIQPMDTSPFAVLFPQKPAGNLQAGIQPVGGIVGAGEPETVNLTLFDLVVESESGVSTVRGRLVNQSLTPVDNVSITLLAYGDDGRLLGFMVHRVDGALTGEADYAFEQQFIPPGGEPVSVDGSVQYKFERPPAGDGSP